jgi:hypothetical protein
MLGLAAGPLAATSVSFAQGGPGGGGAVGANLIAPIINNGAVIGSFVIQRFAAINNQLTAIGTATLTNATGTGNIVTTLAQTVNAITALDPPATGSCPILHLDIAPITLNLLGLQITTSEIVLDIVAIPGPGNLLGNLLCAIAGLLNPGGTLTGILNQLVGLLNQLLGSL